MMQNAMRRIGITANYGKDKGDWTVKMFMKQSVGKVEVHLEVNRRLHVSVPDKGSFIFTFLQVDSSQLFVSIRVRLIFWIQVEVKESAIIYERIHLLLEL